MSQPGRDLLDVHQAALVARRGPETVRRWVRSGRLRARKLGRRLMISRGELDALTQLRAEGRSGSLAEWLGEIEVMRDDSSPRRASAADLVIEDRARRSTTGSRRAGR